MMRAPLLLDRGSEARGLSLNSWLPASNIYMLVYDPFLERITAILIMLSIERRPAVKSIGSLE